MQDNKRNIIYPILVDVSTNLKTVNFYLVKTEQSLVLVDAGWDNEDCYQALHKTLQSNGYSMKDLTEIILTHNHPDHVGLVNRITKEHPIPVYAHEDAIPRLKRDREFLELRLDFFVKLYEEMGCGERGDKQAAYLRKAIEKNSSQAIEIDIITIDKEHLGFDVVEIPGHAPDQIALFDAVERELVSGDLLIEHISSNALVEPDYSGNRLPTLSQHKQSLERIRELGCKRIYPGHGRVIEEPDELLAGRIEGIDKKAAKFKKLIENGISTGSDIAKAYYKNSYNKQFSLVMSEVIGHLDYLERQQQISKEMKKGVWQYSVV